MQNYIVSVSVNVVLLTTCLFFSLCREGEIRSYKFQLLCMTYQTQWPPDDIWIRLVFIFVFYIANHANDNRFRTLRKNIYQLKCFFLILLLVPLKLICLVLFTNIAHLRKVTGNFRTSDVIPASVAVKSIPCASEETTMFPLDCFLAERQKIFLWWSFFHHWLTIFNMKNIKHIFDHFSKKTLKMYFVMPWKKLWKKWMCVLTPTLEIVGTQQSPWSLFNFHDKCVSHNKRSKGHNLKKICII